MAHLRTQSWAIAGLINVIVTDGTVNLWGFVRSDTERKAVCVAAETTPGVRGVNDNLKLWPDGFGD